MSNSKSIGLIAKDNEDLAELCIKNLFQAVSQYFDTVLSESKAALIATEILAKYEYRNLKLEDLVVICFRLKEAEIYKLSIARILREIKSYSKDREALAIENSLAANSTKIINSNIEERIKRNYKLQPDSEKIAAKRFNISNQYK